MIVLIFLSDWNVENDYLTEYLLFYLITITDEKMENKTSYLKKHDFFDIF